MAQKKNPIIKLSIFGDEVKLVHEPILIYDDQHLHGLCDFNNKSIFYANHDNLDELMATIVHELVHYVSYRTGIRQTSLGSDLEEIFAENISRAIVENFNLELKASRQPKIVKKKKAKKRYVKSARK